MYKYFPKLCSKIIYFKHRGKWPNFKDPKGLSEIILSQILTGEINNYSDYVDKVKVRTYIEKLGFADYLPELYGVWDSPEEIDFSLLPDAFALKTNHGSGSHHHYLCKTKKNLNKQEAVNIINTALSITMEPSEPQYSLIDRKCFAEELIIDDSGGEFPIDYKFMCCGGEVKCIFLCGERTTTGVKYKTYNLNWEPIEWILDYTRSNLEYKKPQKLDAMLAIAQRIAADFKQVRVDLYHANEGRIFIGELAFTTNGGYLHQFNNKAERLLGLPDTFR